MDFNETDALMGSGFNHFRDLPKDNPIRWMSWRLSKDGPGLTIEHCIEAAIAHLTYCDNQLSCKENEKTLVHLVSALNSQQEREQKRRDQGIYGTNKPHI